MDNKLLRTQFAARAATLADQFKGAVQDCPVGQHKELGMNLELTVGAAGAAKRSAPSASGATCRNSATSLYSTARHAMLRCATVAPPRCVPRRLTLAMDSPNSTTPTMSARFTKTLLQLWVPVCHLLAWGNRGVLLCRLALVIFRFERAKLQLAAKERENWRLRHEIQKQDASFTSKTEK